MGLMAICLVWAPKNELSVALWFWFRIFLFQISILAYAMFYIVWEVLSLMLAQFQMSTPALHLIGFVVGFGVGTLYVKKEWVDCENWDLFAVMAGTHGRFGDETTTVGSHADPSLLFGKDIAAAELLVTEGSQRHKRTEGILTQVNQLIDKGDYFEASERLFSLRMGSSTKDLSEPRLRRLEVGLHEANAVDEAEMFLEEYADRFDDQSDWCRLRSAQKSQQANSGTQAAEINSLIPPDKKSAGPGEKAGFAGKTAGAKRYQRQSRRTRLGPRTAVSVVSIKVE